MSRHRLLLISHEAGVIATELSRIADGPSITLALSLSDGRAAIDASRPDVVLLDLAQASDPVNLIDQWLAYRVIVPLIVLVGPGEEGQWLARLAVERGASDYLVRDRLESEIVCRSLRYVVHCHSLQRDVNRALLEDPLTELANRSALLQTLTDRIPAVRPSRPLTVMYLDIDEFKIINESLGHRAGDRLLRTFAQRMCEFLNPDELLARFSGDDFVFVSSRFVDEHEAQAFFTKLKTALLVPLSIQGHLCQIKCSAGLVLCTDSEACPQDVLRDADTALDVAKRRGRGQCVRFQADMHARVRDELQLGAEILHGLERDEFRVVYQPIVGIRDGRILGAEALLRWRHPLYGDVSPLRFIPVAERHGHIEELGRRVMEWAIRDGEELRSIEALQATRMCVNVSPLQISLPLIDFLRQSSTLASWKAGLLEIEMTESRLFDQTPAALACIDALREMAIRIAIDDFGTGYSCLTQLHRVPFDTIKIDGGFVAELSDQSNHAGLTIRTIQALADHYEAATVAERVETTHQLGLLRELGCHEAQGNILGRPMPAETFRQWAVEWTEDRREIVMPWTVTGRPHTIAL